jgi:hypothetical protein
MQRLFRAGKTFCCILHFSLFFTCSTNPLAPDNPEQTAVSYDGKTDQDLVTWFIIDNDRLTFMNFSWLSGDAPFGRSGVRGSTDDPVPVLQNGKFTYADSDGGWSIAGERDGRNFSGKWSTKNPEQSGTWSASESTTLLVQTETITAKIGNLLNLDIEGGVPPYEVINEPDSDIATAEISFFGGLRIRIRGKGETSVTLGDQSLYQLTSSITIKVE